jgi:hypothetical protein
MDGDELDFRLDEVQRVGDRLETLGAAVGDPHVHEREVGAEAQAKHLLIIGRDDDDALRYFRPIDELLDRPQPHRAAIEVDEGLLFFVAEAC